MRHSTNTFNAKLYAQAYPDVALSGLTPEVHYERYGRLLGRNPSPLIDDRFHVPVDAIAPLSNNDGQQSLATSHPALLDRLYDNGTIAQDAIVRHNDLVSIIMPSYNNETWIRRAIHSALSQRGVNVELLVIDDGSTDGSVSIARRIAKDHPNMRVYSLLRNFGCYYARNIGLMHAHGAYVTVIDSDDIVAPDFIMHQLSALKTTPGAVASRCHQRRWSLDFTRPLRELKRGENSLLWRRDLIDSIGWYDTVRFSGDGEFRFRIQRTHGRDSIVVLPDELYFLRTRTASLTSDPRSGVFSLTNGELKVSISEPRSDYENSFTAWQKANKQKPSGEPHTMRIDFPQFSRPFKLGSPEQNASPTLGQKRVGAMATFPPRQEALKASVTSILPQLDELIIYLNNYKEVPDFLKNPKIRAVLGAKAEGDLRDNGKFYDLPSDENSYIFTFDDDLQYPQNYVSHLIHQIELLGRSCIVGLHGVIFPKGEFSSLKERTVYHFSHEASGVFVDLLGTGTTAWHSSTFKPSLKDFHTKGVADLWFAVAAAQKEVPLFSVPRQRDWVKEYKRFEDRLYREALSQPQGYFDVYNEYVEPALQGGRIRRRMEHHLSKSFDSDTLKAAGIATQVVAGTETAVANLTRRDIRVVDHPDRVFNHAVEKLHFHVVINGWNCIDFVDACLRSVALQEPGPYTYQVTLVDDGSDDGTYEKLATSSILPGADLIRLKENTGPAHARHVAISPIKNPETIVVLVDMDDALEPHALKSVAERYHRNSACMMTIGNWCDQKGRINPQTFYSVKEIDEQRIREVELFNATHLRTFRRKLYDAINKEDLLDHKGDWLTTCTDVALMFPLIDQCWSDEIEFIMQPIYRYTRQHSGGTLARFGKPHKVERLAWLKAKPPKPRLNRDRPVKHDSASSPVSQLS